MAHGIEIRVPFLDDSFQRYCNRISAHAKYESELPKALLIQAFKNELPEAVWHRPKMGFSFPFKEWFAKSEFVKDILQSGSKRSKKNYQEFLNGELHWSQLLSLLIIRKRHHA